MKKVWFLGLLALFCSGCLTTAPYWIRRSVVHDDWVYVKKTNMLYRRYIPAGVRLKGNPELLKAAGSITSSNDGIIVYPNYGAASEQHPKGVVHEDSAHLIPGVGKMVGEEK